jgi:beta-1,2-mannobiose phosphorylase / 1,2-beta-oligomannan phosphorylase
MEIDTIIVIAILFLVLLGCLLLWLLRKKKKGHPHFYLSRVHCNPIVTPEHDWEEQGTFNPAVFKDDNGYHILYRAIGNDGVSRVGYAHSANGIEVSYRLPYPIFSMDQMHSAGPHHYDLQLYPSGGSWGGCEDPRIVEIEDRIYMTFSAFQGWQTIQMAVTSIAKEDFINGKWKWSKPLLISPHDEQHKNWVLFPEKINGKFAVLHSITPSILIDYADNLEELVYGDKPIKSRVGPSRGGRPDYWDNRVRGAGPPPIKTKDGWLLLYHAISHHEGHMYKLGALLLDKDDPQKIIARSPTPILVPREWYENEWKPGIVYACGAVVHNDTLSVYYGGGDKYLCAANASLSKLLEWLLKYGSTNN